MKDHKQMTGYKVLREGVLAELIIPETIAYVVGPGGVCRSPAAYVSRLTGLFGPVTEGLSIRLPAVSYKLHEIVKSDGFDGEPTRDGMGIHWFRSEQEAREYAGLRTS